MEDRAVRLQLLTRWNGYMGNDIISVSDERAIAMQEAGIGRVLDQPKVETPAEEAPKPKKK